MATATLGLLGHTAIDRAESTSGWVVFDTLDTDIKKEGSNGIKGTFRADGVSGYFDAGSAPVTAANKHIRVWINTTNLPYMQPESSNGYEFYMYDGSITEYVVMFGSDTYFGGWKNFVIDCNLFTTLTLANVQRWGIRGNHHTSAKNVDNCWADYIRYLDGYSITGGSGSDDVTLADVELADRGTTTLYGYGIIGLTDSVYFAAGEIQIGNGTTTTYFAMDGEVLIFTDQNVSSSLYALSGDGSGCTLVITGSVIKAAGSTAATRFAIDMATGTPSSVLITKNVITRAGLCTFASGQTITGNKFVDCLQITHGGADMSDCVVEEYEGTVGTSALVYNVNTDPDGEMDGMVLTKGTAATHAIEFGITSPLTMTLRDCVFSGYNASGGQNDSTFHFARTSGDVTLNLIGCSGNFTYTDAGCNVTIVVAPVTTLITVKDIDTGNPVQYARVLLYALDGTGDFFYQAAITSILRSGSTATVTQTGHGLSTDDWVWIEGANEQEYLGCFQVTYISSTQYSYTVPGTPDSPATGTIIATEVLFNEETDVNGQVSDTREFAADQPLTGRIRKSTVSPLYKSQPFTCIVDTENGVSINVLLVRDD